MTDKGTLKRIEAEAEKFVQNLAFRESEHVTVLSPIQCFIAGAKSERNKVLDEAIENVTKLGENVDPIFQVAFYSIINELKSLKL